LLLGDIGYYGYINNNCIHRSWVKLNEQIVYPHWAYPMKLNKDEVFIHYCETTSKARGKNIYPHVFSNIIEKHQGKEVLISVNDKNIVSIKGVEKVGFRERESENSDCLRDKIYQEKKPRVMIITMGLSRIVQPIVSKHNVVGIIECASRNIQKVNNNIIYDFLKYCYTRIKPNVQTLKTFSKDNKLAYYHMDNGSDKNLENWVKYINPDIIVVYSMSQLLKDNIFNIPKHGTINLHPALLPSYRGPFPEFWMYYNTEKKGGVTVHYIDRGEDTGDIIYQEKYDIPLGMKSPDMMNLAIGKIGTNLLLKALNNLGNLPRIAQPKESTTQKARNIQMDEHENIIDWNNWDIEKIWHLLNGTELWLNAIKQPSGIFTGHRWTIKEFIKCDTKDYKISNIYKENNRNFIACNDGKIFLYVKLNIKNMILNIIR